MFPSGLKQKDPFLEHSLLVLYPATDSGPKARPQKYRQDLSVTGECWEYSRSRTGTDILELGDVGLAPPGTTHAKKYIHLRRTEEVQKSVACRLHVLLQRNCHGLYEEASG